MMTELARQQNDIKAVRARIAAAGERYMRSKVDKVEKVDPPKVEPPKVDPPKVEPTEDLPPQDMWVEKQITKHKPLWLSIVSTIKLNRLSGPPIKDIQKAVCAAFGVSLNDLLSARRTGKLIIPRHVAMYLSKELTTLSLPTIGKAMGGRDHTVPLYAHRKIAKLLETDEELAAKVALIRGQFE